MGSLPKISINIPLVPGGSDKPVLEAIKSLDYPKKLIEIIVVEGKNVGKQRNKAINSSKGDIVYLLDDDSKIQQDALKIIAEEFTDPKVAAVGGPSLVESNTKESFNDLVALTLSTRFGAARMRFRYSGQPSGDASEYKLIGANLALRKSAVKKVGMFNEQIYPCDETDILRRLQNADYKIKYNNNLFIFRDHRKSLIDLARQFFFYGTGRMKQIKRGFKLEYTFFLIPIMFTMYLVSLFFYRSSTYLAPLIMYLILSLGTSLAVAWRSKKYLVAFLTFFIFPIIHVAYSIGLICEFFKDHENVKTGEVKLKMNINGYQLQQATETV